MIFDTQASSRKDKDNGASKKADKDRQRQNDTRKIDVVPGPPFLGASGGAAGINGSSAKCVAEGWANASQSSNMQHDEKVERSCEVSQSVLFFILPALRVCVQSEMLVNRIGAMHNVFRLLILHV